MMTRYLTRWYVTTDLDDVQRLAGLDHTPEEEIKVAPGVEPLHVAPQWSYWSDGCLIGHSWGGTSPTVVSLTPDAANLIDLVMGSDSGHVDGGRERLIRIDKILGRQLVAPGETSGVYNPPTVERLRVRWLDETETDLYTYSCGYFEGYRFEVYDSLEGLRQGIQA
jgi:hypothetical protein